MAELRSTPAPTKRENIQVIVRVRPMNEKERLEKKNQNVVDLKRDRDVVVRDRTNLALTRTFSFDRAFGPNSKQVDVYKSVAEPMIAEVLAGYNCTIFAYGQTGTGKTFTMEGERTPGEATVWDKDPLCGLVPRVLSHMFDELRVRNMEFTMAVNYLELYNEELIDLLSPEEDNSKLRLFEDAAHKGSVIVQGLTDVRVLDKKQVYDILTQGSKKRQTAATLMNATSSRSHTVFTVTIHIRESTEAGEDLIRTGKINLVDLAGSENISRSGATNQRAKEAGNINQSLLTLGRVITALVEKTPHIPYRESKLTRLLQDSLGGKTKTCIVATVSPVMANLEETLSTLDYAHRAKSITNRPQINQRLSKQAFIKEYDQEIERLRKDLAAQRSGNLGQGFYVDPDNYNEMVQKLERQDLEITEKIQLIRHLEDERDKRESFLSELTEKLEETTGRLEETSTALQVTEKDRDEKEVLLHHHRATEDVLKIETTNLIGVTDDTVSDLSKVHEALSKKKNLESINKKAAQTFSATIGNLIHTGTLETNYYSEQQQEIVHSARTQISNIKKLNKEVVATLSSELDEVTSVLCSETKESLEMQEKHLSEVEALEKKDMEVREEKSQNLRKKVEKSQEVEQMFLSKLMEMQEQLAQLKAAHVQDLTHLGQQKVEEMELKFSQQAAAFAEMVNGTESKVSDLEEHLKKDKVQNVQVIDNLVLEKLAEEKEKEALQDLVVAMAEERKFMFEQSKFFDVQLEVVEKLSKAMEEQRKVLDGQKKIMEEHRKIMSEKLANHFACSEQRRNNTCQQLEASVSRKEEQEREAGTILGMVTLLATSYQVDCEEMMSETKNKFAVVDSAILEMASEETQAISEIKTAVTSLSETVAMASNDMDSELISVAQESKSRATKRAEMREQQSAAMAAKLEQLKINTIAQEKLAATSVELKLGEVNMQVGCAQETLQKVNVAAEQWSTAAKSHLQTIQQNAVEFVESDLKEYVPSGSTPCRQDRIYPRQLKFTSPAGRILARHYAEMERVHNGGDSGLNSPSNSVNSDLENQIQELPLEAFVAKAQAPNAQRRILGSRNDAI